MARDLFAEYGIDPATVGNNSSSGNSGNGTTGSPSAPNVPANPPRDLFAEYGINPQEANQGSWMPTSSMRDILGGIATGVQNVHNLLTPKSMNTNYDFNAPGSIGLGIDYPTQGDKAVQGIAQYAPAAALPEAPLIGDALGAGSWAARTAGKYLPNIVPQGTYGAAQNPNDRITGALYGAGGAALGQAGGDLLNALRPSQLFRGGLSPEELQANVEATQGTNTPLGEVIASPTLNRLQENVLPHILFSGAEDTMKNTANQVTDQGNQIMQKLGIDLYNNGETPGAQIKDALINASREATNQKNTIFSPVNSLAENLGFQVGRDNLQKNSQDILSEINSKPELARKIDPSLLNDLNYYSSNSAPASLKTSDVLKGLLREQASDFYKNGQPYAGGIVSNLKNSLNQDITDSLNNAPPQLIDARNAAMKFYKENFSQFNDSDITKFTRGDKDSDLILDHFLKGGQNDRANLLEKLQNAISPSNDAPQTSQAAQIPELRSQISQEPLESQMMQQPIQNTQSLSQPGSTLLPYAYLSRSLDEDGQVNPVKFAQLYNKLGQNQKNILIKDPEMRNMLDNYTNLVGKNKEAFNLMFNPKTGARNTGLLIDLFQGLGGLGGAHLGGFPGAVLGQLATSAGGRLTNHLLTSPSFRESIVKAMIKNQKWQTPQLATSTAGALGSMVGNSNSGQ